MSRADRLLQTVRERAIPHAKSGIADHITVSIGVVTCRQSSIKPIAPNKLIKAADEMLYKAKAAGRNQAFNDLLTQNTGNTANGADLISAPYVVKSK